MYASSGKTSNRKNDILENPPVNNKIPTTNSKSPINLSTNNICFCNFLIIVTDCEINKADSKNGTNLKEEAVKLGFIDEKGFDDIVRPENMIGPKE